MVDVCLALTEQGFEGPIHAISRRGLLPLGHAPSKPWEQLALTAEDRRSLLALFRAVRREVRRAGASAVGWRAVIDAVRPHAQTLWAELSSGRQGPVRPPCPALVGRPPPPHGAAGRRHPGRLARLRRRHHPCRPHRRDRARRRCACGSAGAPKGRPVEQQLLAQRVIDCTGCHRRSLPQRRALDPADAGRRPRPPGTLGPRRRLHRLGCPDRRPRPPAPDLFAVGPITRGALWEIIAVPEIRAQAEQIAERVLEAARAKVAA